MKLAKLIDQLKIEKIKGQKNIEIKGVAYDSREVKTGDIFVAIQGFETDGHQFISQAINNGAKAIVVEKEPNQKNEITTIKTADTRQTLAAISQQFYDFPDKKLKLIGVTGTNGKTTTAYLLEQILAHLGYKTGLISSLENKIADTTEKADLTTPESLDIYKLLSRMVDKGVEYAVMEVSSHALELKRIHGLSFNRQILTNVAADHLKFHGSFAAYLEAKTKLFKLNKKPAIINLDLFNNRKVAAKNCGPIISYGLKPPTDFRASQIKTKADGTSYLLSTDQKEIQLNLNLIGKFNVYNSLAAIATLDSLGFKLTAVKQALAKIKPVPGRCEIVHNNPLVIIDGAHNQSAAAHLSNTINNLTFSRLFIVLSIFSDKNISGVIEELIPQTEKVFITQTENNRAAKLQTLEEKISSHTSSYQTNSNPKTAIKEALKQAKSDDLILITGSLTTALAAKKFLT